MSTAAINTTAGTGRSWSAPVEVIGRDVGWFGRIYRVVAGTFATIGVASEAIGQPGGFTAPAVATAGYLAGLAVFYGLFYRVLGPRVLDKIGPFLSTVLVLAPLAVFELSVFPTELRHAVGLYVGASLVLSGLIGYGGCEVIAPATALFGHRYTVYCPINILDAAERSLRTGRDRLGQGAAIVALVVAGYYLVAARILDQLGVPALVGPRWALVLLAPAGLLAVRAWQSHARHGRPRGNGDVSVLALGAAATAAGAFVLARLASADVFFGAAILAGLVAGGVGLLRLRRARRTVPDKGRSDDRNTPPS